MERLACGESGADVRLDGATRDEPLEDSKFASLSAETEVRAGRADAGRVDDIVDRRLPDLDCIEAIEDTERS